MRFMSPINHAKRTAGFTLIEVLIIAPIVVLVIGGFVALMMAMVGDVLLTRDQNVMAYETQDALDRIEQDTRIGTQFLNTSRTLPAPQGSGDGVAAFTSSNALIMGALATDKNPSDPNRQLVYYADQPNACGPTQAQNRVFINKIIYYTKAGSLWRRVIVPPYDTDTPSTVFTLCSTPWQQNSCSPGYTITPPCRANDSEIMKNIESFTVKYYDSPAADNELTGADILNASTIDVSIVGKKTTAGKVADASGTIRASKLNSINADIPPPTTPVISHAFVDSPTPAVNFSWSTDPNATSYQISYSVNGGAPTEATVSSTTLSQSVAAFRNDDVLFKVASVNTSGVSPDALDTATIPPWTEVDTLNDWNPYNTNVFTTPAYTITKDKVVVLKGMIKEGITTTETPLFVLPPGYRPDFRQIFIVGSYAAGSGTGRIDVRPNGEVIFISGTNTWISLDNIRFLPSGAYPQVYMPEPLLASWTNYNANDYADLRVAKDVNNRVHTSGLIRNGTTTSGTAISSQIPAAYQTSQYMLFPSMGSGTYFGAFGVLNGSFLARGLYSGYMSMQSMYYANGHGGWINLGGGAPTYPLLASWVWYTSNFSTPQYTKASDGLVTVKGLIKSGTVANGTVIANLPAGYRPGKKLIFPALGAAVSGNGGHVRLDVAPNGNITIEGNGGNTYLSLDHINFLAEL